MRLMVPSKSKTAYSGGFSGIKLFISSIDVPGRNPLPVKETVSVLFMLPVFEIEKFDLII
jgi:hypothetical protein